MNAAIYNWIWSATDRDVRVALFKMIERCPHVFQQHVVEGADPQPPAEWDTSGSEEELLDEFFATPYGARFDERAEAGRDERWVKQQHLTEVHLQQVCGGPTYAMSNADEAVARSFPLNEKIMAIRHIRAVTGCGLRDAKDIYEQHYQALAAKPPPRTHLEQAVDLLARVHWTGHQGGDAGRMFDERGGCESWMRERNELLDKIGG